MADTERVIVDLLRSLLSHPGERDRERLADSAVLYIRAFTMSHLRQRRFGFGESFADVATSAAGIQVARLLQSSRRQPENGEEPREDLARLRSAMHRRLIQEAAAPRLPARRRARIRRAAQAVAAGATIPAELPDDVVLACWRSILRGLAHRGIIEVWNQEHPELARQLRALKRILAKGEGVRIRKENARGQLLVSDGSALHRPCIDRDALQRMLHPIPRSVPDLAGLLPSILVPSEIHGGSAFLMDFLIAWEDVLRREVPPDTEESASSRDGVPIERLAGELPPILRRRARDLLRADQRKGTFAGDADDPACRLSNAYVEISVEMVSRDCGVGNPEWSRLSQKKLIERLLPDVATDGVLARHQQKIDYLVLRLRGTIRVQP